MQHFALEAFLLAFASGSVGCLGHDPSVNADQRPPANSLAMVVTVGDLETEIDRPALAFPKGSGQMEGWIGYALARRAWIDVKFRQHFPNQPEYKYTFDEEVYARDEAANKWSALDSKKELSDRYFGELSSIRHAGFIREYVWFCVPHYGWNRPVGLRQGEFTQWLSEHLPDHQVETRVAVVYGKKMAHVIVGLDSHNPEKCNPAGVRASY